MLGIKEALSIEWIDCQVESPHPSKSEPVGKHSQVSENRVWINSAAALTIWIVIEQLYRPPTESSADLPSVQRLLLSTQSPFGRLDCLQPRPVKRPPKDLSPLRLWLLPPRLYQDLSGYLRRVKRHSKCPSPLWLLPLRLHQAPSW